MLNHKERKKNEPVVEEKIERMLDVAEQSSRARFIMSDAGNEDGEPIEKVKGITINLRTLGIRTHETYEKTCKRSSCKDVAIGRGTNLSV